MRIKTGIRLSSINKLPIFCCIPWMFSFTIPLHSVSPAAGRKDGIVSTVMKLWTGKLRNHTVPGKVIKFILPSIQTGSGAHSPSYAVGSVGSLSRGTVMVEGGALILTGVTEVLGENPVPVLVYPPQIPQGLA
jgi:hypothetical protein